MLSGGEDALQAAADTRQGFVWDSPVPVDWLILGALAVVLWLALLAVSEWRLAKRAWLLPFLWLLRAAAVVALAAAVAGPSRTLTHRQSSRQAVSILVDTSASMTLTDKDEYVPAWTHAGGSPQDTALGQLAAARHHLRRLAAVPPGQWGTPAGEQRWADAVATMTKPEASAGAPEDFRQAAARLAETAEAFTSGRSVLARDCLRVLNEAEAAVTERMNSLEAKSGGGLSGAPAGSGSGGGGGSPSRLQRVADWLEAAESGWLKECREEFDVTLFDAGEVTVPASGTAFQKWRAAAGDASPQRTDLATVLDETARESAVGRTRAVVLVTDGGHNAERGVEAAAARLRGLPLLVVPAGAVIGGPQQKDLSLPSLLAPASVYKNDSMKIEAVVSAAGCEGATVEAVLKEGDRRLETKTFRIRDGAPETPLEFAWKPEKLGRHPLRVELTPLKGEAILDNNHQEISVEVLDDTLRLLIADGEPRWETRYLLNLLKRDARMEFEPLLFAPLHSAEGPPPPPPVFPYDLDGWARYRIVVLGDVTPAQLTPEHQALLVKYVVERGGTLVVIAGGEAMPAAFMAQPLGALIPVTKEAYPEGASYSITLSPEGRTVDSGRLADTAAESSRVWREATERLPVYDLSAYSKPKPQAHVLLQANPLGRTEPPPGRAFLTWQDAGKGRVIYLAAPVTWHLRYLSGDQWHYRFWGQLFQWAVARGMSGGSRTVHLSVDRPRVPQDSPLNVLLRLEDPLGKPVAGAECRAVLRTEKGLEKSVVFTADEKVPGSYRAVLTGLPVGPHRIVAEGAAVDSLLKAEGRQGRIDTAITVDPPANRERRDVLCDLGGIRRLTAAAEGSVVPPGAVADALKNLGLRPAVTERTSLTPVWNQWPWLALILGLLTLEWILRKPAGLL
ncbi:MAG: hypothetical protein V4726_05490 [Verrucomicrobiota bacterium]